MKVIFDKTTPADILHPNILEVVGGGKDGNRGNANPNDANDNGGQIHGIGNVPGQAGINPNDDGVVGFANQLNTVHGGMNHDQHGGGAGNDHCGSHEAVDHGMNYSTMLDLGCGIC